MIPMPPSYSHKILAFKSSCVWFSVPWMSRNATSTGRWYRLGSTVYSYYGFMGYIKILPPKGGWCSAKDLEKIHGSWKFGQLRVPCDTTSWTDIFLSDTTSCQIFWDKKTMPPWHDERVLRISGTDELLMQIPPFYQPFWLSITGSTFHHWKLMMARCRKLSRHPEHSNGTRWTTVSLAPQLGL